MATIVVKQSGGDYSSLDSALDNCSDGDTISIEGLWTANDNNAAICDNNNITIKIGDVDAAHNGYYDIDDDHYRLSLVSTHGLVINGTGVVVDGLAIYQRGTGASYEGIRVANDGTTTIKNCLIHSAENGANQDGIYTEYGSNPTINVENCVIWNFRRGAITYVQDAADAVGITTINVNSCTLYGNESGVGIYITEGTDIKTVVVNVHNTLALDNSYDFLQSDSIASPSRVDNTEVTFDVSNSIDSDASIGATGVNSTAGNLTSRTETDSGTPGTGDWVIFEELTTTPLNFQLVPNPENDAWDMHENTTAEGLSILDSDIMGVARGMGGGYECGAFAIKAFVTDDFTGTNGDQLNDGANWYAAGSGGDSDGLDIQSNAAQADHASRSHSSWWVTRHFQADQYAEATVTAITSGVYVGLGVRCSGTDGGADQNGYHWMVDSADAGYLEKYIGGTWTLLDGTGSLLEVGDELRMEVEGTTIRCYINGVLDITHTDSSIDSGAPGLSGYNDGASAVDDWVGGDLGEVETTTEHDLEADDVKTTPELEAPSLGQTHELEANDVRTTPELGTPTLGLDHELDADGLKTTPELSVPSLGQEHELEATGVKTTSELETPALSQEHILGINGVTTTPELETPSLGQEHDLDVTGVTTTLELETPSLGQEHDLDVTGVTIIPELETPSLGQEHALDASGVKAIPELGTPSISEVPSLEADDVSITPVLATPTLGQTHTLGAIEITVTPELEKPPVGLTPSLEATEISVTPELGTPNLGQEHILDATEVVTGPELGIPSLGQEYALDALDLVVGPELGTPTLSQDVILVPDEVTVTPILSNPAVGQTHTLSARELTVAVTLDTPILGTTIDLEAEGVATRPILGTPHVAMTTIEGLVVIHFEVIYVTLEKTFYQPEVRFRQYLEE